MVKQISHEKNLWDHLFFMGDKNETPQEEMEFLKFKQ